MGNVASIARRELMSFFYSPVGYLVLFLYMLFMGIIFALSVLVPGQIAGFEAILELNHIVLVVVIPFLTMSLIADEYRSGRMEMLRTSPVTEGQLVLGKFAGAMAFFCVMLAATLIYVAILCFFGRPDYNTIWTSYLGLLLLGALCVSVGLFFSACTQHQILAAMSTCVTLIVVGILTQAFAPYISPVNAFWKSIRHGLFYLAFEPHMMDFGRGIIDTRNVVFFLTGSFVFLFLTYTVLETKKWR